MRALLLPLLLAACGAEQPTDTPGARLETAARARGMVADPNGSLVGSWASESDRLCVVPTGDLLRVGALVYYGDGQGCAASGEATRKGDRLRIGFGACRVEARFDGERIIFPAELPRACEAACVGRASLTALTVTRQSESVSEAATLRAPNGRLLCGG